MDTAKQKTVTQPVDQVSEAEIFDERSREIAGLRDELASERDLRMRLLAEFDNYRRRIRRDQAAVADAGKRELLEQLISLVDDLDLAITNLDGEADAVAEALRITHRRFNAMLEAHGVMGFESLGQKFDPERHEAFDIAKDSESDPGNVHAELRRGYFWNEKLLRPALVVVAM